MPLRNHKKIKSGILSSRPPAILDEKGEVLQNGRKKYFENKADGTAEFEAEMIVKGIEISWTTWGRMRGEKLITGLSLIHI